MLDDIDPTDSALRLILLEAVKSYDDDQLLAWLENDEPMLRTAAARELHLRPGDKCFEHIAKLCRSTRFEAREVAAFVLGQFGTPSCPYAQRSLDLLERLLDDDYFEVQIAAVSALGQLASLGHEPPKKIQAAIIGLSGHSRPGIRSAVAYALLSFGSKRVGSTLQRLLEDDNPTVRDAAEFCFAARRELCSEMMCRGPFPAPRAAVNLSAVARVSHRTGGTTTGFSYLNYRNKECASKVARDREQGSDDLGG